VDDLPCLEPLEEPARFVGVVVAGQILIEEQQNVAGEAITGDQYQCGRGIVGFLLEVDHLVVVAELDEPAGRRSLVGADIVGGQCRLARVREGIEEVGDIEADQIVAGDDERIVGEILTVESRASAPTTLNVSSSTTVSSTERWGLITPRLCDVRLEIGGERLVGRDVYVLNAAVAIERIERRSNNGLVLLSEGRTFINARADLSTK